MISFAAFPQPNCTKVAATGPRPWLALLEPFDNELHSTWLELDEKRSFFERFKYHVPAFGLKEDARTRNTSFEPYTLDLSQGIIRQRHTFPIAGRATFDPKTVIISSIRIIGFWVKLKFYSSISEN